MSETFWDEKPSSNKQNSIEDFVYFSVVHVMIENNLLKWKRHYCRSRATCLIKVHARHLRLLSGEGSLSCHTNCNTGPRFLQSHPNGRPNSLVAITTRRGNLGPILGRISLGLA